MSRRQVRVTKEQNAECQRLLKLMGIPVIMVRYLLYRCRSPSIDHSSLPTLVGAGRGRSAGGGARQRGQGASHGIPVRLSSLIMPPTNVTTLSLYISQVFAAGSEDMDTMTFNTPILLRHLTFSEQKKAPISEIHLDKILEGLEMTMSQVCAG